MTRLIQWLLILGTALSAGAWAAQSAPAKGLAPSALRCEYKVNPLGVGEPKPRLSWIVESSQRAQKQTAYQVLAAATEAALRASKGDLWDSGKVAGDATTAVVYAGQALASHQQVFWKVRVWDKDGKPSNWSRNAQWSMGLLAPADWKAEWIGYDKGRQPATEAIKKALEQKDPKKRPKVLWPVPYLRTGFTVEKPVVRATLYASALGIADFRLNGRLVSPERFAPGWTDYAKRVYYKTYDVTRQIKQGPNALGAVLSDGWYSGYVGYGGERDLYGKQPRVRAQLRLEFADGSTQDVASSSAWKASYGPLLEADFLMGEVYDARKALTGWDAQGFDDKGWNAVVTGAELTPLMQAHPGEPVVAYTEIKPVRITEPKPGVYIFDMGQNFAGVIRLKVKGNTGQTFTLRYAEVLNPDGSLYVTNLRGARCTDRYICASRGNETWEPRFTFHGFRYVELTGLGTDVTQHPSLDWVVGLPLTSNTPIAGKFACSDPMLNQLHENIVRTQLSNFIDIPTDCPQRDERLGWTGDAQVYIRTATLNTDAQAFFTKWLVDLEDAQRPEGEFTCVAPAKVSPGGGGPAWADAGVICPWNVYAVYGDTRVLERHYDSMKKFIAFNEGRCQPGLVPPAKFHCFGDWLSIKADTPKDLIFMAYFAASTQRVAQIAELLGKPDEAKKYNDLLARIKESFRKLYVGPDGRIKGDTQCDYVLALANDLLTPEQARQAAQYLVENIEKRDWHLSTGFIGTKDLMLVLAKIGRNDVAYRLLHNETFPSWGFSIKQGATSIWERWDGWTPDKGFQDAGMNSFAHYSFGAVYQWMAQNIGGIASDGVAFKKIVIAPQPGGKLTEAKVSYNSIRGVVATDWKVEDGMMKLCVTIPANTEATVVLPTADAAAVTESGKPLEQAEGLKLQGVKDGRVTLTAGSGQYAFEITGKVITAGMAGAK